MTVQTKILNRIKRIQNPTKVSGASVLSLINGRSKELNRVKYSYQLNENSQYGLDTAFANDAEIDESRMSVVIPFADGNNRDGVGDLLEVEGIVTTRHLKNPIFLFDHGKQITLPVGLTEDPETKEYTVEIDPIAKIAKAKAFFYQGKGMDAVDGGDEYEHAIFCQQLFDLIAKRYVRAGSIGYSIRKAYQLQPDYESGVPQGMHLLSVLMLEASAVILPASADTVRKALDLPQICGKPLSPYLVKSLTPYAALNTKTSVGFADVIKTKSVPVPLNENLNKTKVPPPKWKPGVGAVSNATAEYIKFKALRSKYKSKSQPSDKIKPGKACTILKDGTAQGHKLTEKQRGMFGAACGSKDIKSLRMHYRKAIKPKEPVPEPQHKFIGKRDIKSIRVSYRNKLVKGFAEVQLKFNLSNVEFNQQNAFVAEMEQAGYGLPKQGRYEGNKLQVPLKLATFSFDVKPESEQNNAIAEAIRNATGIANKYGAQFLGNVGRKSLK